jgi:hypothetical protein
MIKRDTPDDMLRKTNPAFGTAGLSSNGRVNANANAGIITPSAEQQFALFDKIHVNQPVTFRNALDGIWEESTLSKLFFSSKNIQIIQNGIRAGVHKMSGGDYVIPVQDEDTVKIIMRSIYLQNASNLPFNITDQIIALNDLVCEYAIPRIYNEARGYLTYKNDISTMYTPMARPHYSDYKTNSLQLKPWY